MVATPRVSKQVDEGVPDTLPRASSWRGVAVVAVLLGLIGLVVVPAAAWSVDFVPLRDLTHPKPRIVRGPAPAVERWITNDWVELRGDADWAASRV